MRDHMGSLIHPGTVCDAHEISLLLIENFNHSGVLVGTSSRNLTRYLVLVLYNHHKVGTVLIP